ncbi:MAG: DNA polymerase/3'-5' exonuclease PolX [Parcubacteria group bacterium]|nr:DNA polymerase/3'-5' exonuclease PolX [Parcubacteria group bacterium]
MINDDLAKLLKRLAFYLEMEGVSFKPQAYEKASIVIDALDEDIKEIYQKDKIEGLKKIPGIGESIAQKIEEYIQTGKIKEIERYRKKYPINLDELIGIEGIGPKTIKTLYEKLKITNLKELEEAAQSGKIRNLENFGEKSEKNILESIEFLKRSQGRFYLDEAYYLAQDIIKELKKVKEIDKIVVAGSLRRMKETIGDIDLLTTLKTKNKDAFNRVMDTFVNLKGVIKVWDYGQTKSSVRFKRGIDVDLRVVDDYEFGSALQYFTGSKEHNIETRKLAIEKGLKLNEYGIFRKVANKSRVPSQWKRIAGTDEKEVYQAIGLPYIEPELRENNGEIEAALKNQLPKIIDYHDIKGDLHCHSDWNGGSNSLEEIIETAKSLGYEYMGISDHTKFLRIEHGLDEKQLLEQHQAIEKLNSRFQIQNSKFRLLHGCEANILNDGSLDIDDKVLKQLDYVIAGIHSHMKMSKDEMTERIIRAMKNPNVDIISHPTGRLINQRDEYQVDLDKIFKAAKEYQVALEINAHPIRLDLNDKNIRKAIDYGVKLVINTDAHHISHMELMKFGISQARRGWATQEDIINSWPLDKLLLFFKN